MKFAPAPHLAVPTGTAAATVVSTSPHADPVAEGRRFAVLAALGGTAFAERFAQLLAQGVYARFERCVMVLRISVDGQRSFAAVLAGGVAAGPGHEPAIAVVGTGAGDATAALRALLEGESRQRPVFHGATAEGVTLTGFLAEQPDAILAALARAGLDAAPDAPLAAVFAGEARAVPVGLFVRLPA